MVLKSFLPAVISGMVIYLMVIYTYTPLPSSFLTIFSPLSMCQGQWNGTFDKVYRSIFIILLPTCSWMITGAYNVSLPLPIHSLFTIGKHVYLLIELCFFVFTRKDVGQEKWHLPLEASDRIWIIRGGLCHYIHSSSKC